MIQENISPGKSEYGTPPELADAIHALLDGVDLDPASSPDFNAVCMRAERIYTEADNGLDQPWHGKIYLNPPGGKRKKGQPATKAWWRKLVEEYALGHTTQAVYMNFALDSFQWSQKVLPVTSFPTLIFAKRIKFWHHDPSGQLVQSKRPNRPCALTWIHPITETNPRAKFAEFAKICESLKYAGSIVGC